MRWQHALTFILVLATTTPLVSAGQPLSAKSPDGSLEVTVTNVSGQVSYSVSRFGNPVLGKSRLGLVLADRSLADNLVITDTAEATVDTTWEQVWGERRFVKDHHKELRVHVASTTDGSLRMTVVFRVFDDGVGFRYEVPEQPGLSRIVIMDEATEFALAEDPTAWWIGAYQWNRYEYLYRESPLSKAADTL
ncbi:MAG: glycoside hydrolase family 97 N-terminal domain-containing protein, partial [Rhodothermales bacterium]|nr:glycoside hydrolase family 97 N-terminal domain-containing protein [Rhodothermales bacterium]